jgi:Mannosyltransferase (PIG-V)
MSIPKSESTLQDMRGQTAVAIVSAQVEKWILILRTRYGWTIRPLVLAAAIRILVYVVSVVGVRLLDLHQFPGLLAIWLRKDDIWYTKIAMGGYFYLNGIPVTANFFPLYPLSIAIVQHLTGLFLNSYSYLAAGMAISWVAFLAACVLLFRLVADRFGDQTAYLSVLLLAVFPFSYFYGAAYTESLFLLFVLLAFTGIERGNWWLAGIGAMLAGATHGTGLAVGLAVVVGYVVDWIRTRHRLRWDLLALAPVPLGTAAFAVYCWIHFGNPFSYLIAGKEYWKAGIQWTSIHMAASTLIHPQLWLHGSPSALLYLIYTLLILAFLAACYPVYRLLGASYLAYSLPIILASLIDHPGLNGYGRYLSVVFPVFIVLAYLLRDRPMLREITIIGFTLLLATAVIGFTSGLGFS